MAQEAGLTQAEVLTCHMQSLRSALNTTCFSEHQATLRHELGIPVRIRLDGPSGDFTGEFSQCRFPLFVVPRLASPEVDSQRTKVGRAGFLRGAAEDVGPPGDLKTHKTGCHYRGLKLCIQQSTGNSTCP